MTVAFGKRIRGLGILLAVMLSVGGCVSAGVEFTTTTGPDEFSAPTLNGPAATETTATVGKASVQYPADWYVIPTGSMAREWEWGAQSRPGATPRGTLAVGRRDGKVVAIGDDIISSGRDRPGWELRDRKPVKITGATKAERIDSGFPLKGQDYQFVLLVVQESASSTVVIQIAAPAPMDTGLIANLIDGIALT